MSDIAEPYRTVVVYESFTLGEKRYRYSKVYRAKNAATAYKNQTVKMGGSFYARNTIANPNYTGWNGSEPYRIPDPDDLRTDDELFPFVEAYVERAVEWERVS